MQESHYSPAARVELLAPDVDDDGVARRAGELVADGARVAELAPRSISGLPAEVVVLHVPRSVDEYAAVLYRELREADRHDVRVVLVVPPAATGIGAAVVDRLRRAAT
jgi:hypothetical protein